MFVITSDPLDPDKLRVSIRTSWWNCSACKAHKVCNHDQFRWILCQSWAPLLAVAFRSPFARSSLTFSRAHHYQSSLNAIQLSFRAEHSRIIRLFASFKLPIQKFWSAEDEPSEEDWDRIGLDATDWIPIFEQRTLCVLDWHQEGAFWTSQDWLFRNEAYPLISW